VEGGVFGSSSGWVVCGTDEDVGDSGVAGVSVTDGAGGEGGWTPVSAEEDGTSIPARAGGDNGLGPGCDDEEVVEVAMSRPALRREPDVVTRKMCLQS
jgi:hypothetical protein